MNVVSFSQNAAIFELSFGFLIDEDWEVWEGEGTDTRQQ